MLKIPDQNEFDEKFDVFSLDEVVAEVRDEKVREKAVFKQFSIGKEIH